VDVLNHRVQKFDTNGNFILKWGKEGTGNGEFTQPSGIAVDSQNVYVLDHSNRIQVFDKDGQFIRSLGSSGSNPGQLDHPEDIEIDSSGRIYVADSGNDRIQVYFPNNQGGIVWGTQGTGIGQFNYPQGISVPEPGHVFVADSHNNRIQYFILSDVCPQGSTIVQTGVCFVREWGKSGSGDGQLKRPADITISNNVVYVVDANNNRMQLFTKEGTFIKKFGSECLVKTGLKPSNGCKGPDNDQPEKGDGQFKYPAGVTVKANTIYVADNFNDRVQVFTVEPGPFPLATTIPIANAGDDQTVDSGQIVTLDGELSKPDDGSLKFNWRQSGGSQAVNLDNSDTSKPTFNAPDVTQDMTLKFDLKVTNSDNQFDIDTVNVNVIANQQDQNQNQNQKPDANAGSDKTVYEGEIVELDGTASHDLDGSIQSYEWEAEDCDNNQPRGSIQNSDNAITSFVSPHISSSSSMCQVHLKVTDNDGDEDTDSIEINVNEKPPQNTGPFNTSPASNSKQ
jgi:hypothetical protein